MPPRMRTHTPLGALIRARGFTGRQVSERTGIAPPVLSEYLSGRTPISRRNLGRLSEFFDLDAEKLQTPPDVVAASLRKLGRTRNWDHS